MSVLSLAEISELIQNPKNGNAINAAKKQSKKLNLHVNGVGVQEYLQRIENYENAKQAKLRKKVAKSLKGIYSTITRPTDKIFSARGGSVIYDLPENQQVSFREILSEVGDGKNLRNWIHCYWLPRYIDDPNGIILIEVDEDGELEVTNKSIWSIHDYEVKRGQCLQYIIFEPTEETVRTEGIRAQGKVIKKYRVIDDAFDYMIKWDGKIATVIEDETFPNFFGEPPGVINSNIIADLPTVVNDKTKETVFIKKSFVQDSLEVADELLLDGSIHSIYKFLHNYPIFWRYMQPCPTCQGSGMKEGDTCTTCNGTKYLENKDVSDVVELKIPKDDDVKITPDIAGYVSPDLETWDQQNQESQLLTKAIEITTWGTHTREDDAVQETATGRFLDIQPVLDRLHQMSTGAEIVETKLTDWFGKFHFESSYGGSSIQYGRRYQVETPDQIWKKYEEAREKGAPRTTLNLLLIQFYMAEFSQDNIGLQTNIKLIRIEPWVHLSEEEVKGLDINQEDYLTKVYFNEWVQQKKPTEIILTDQSQLTQDLVNFVKNRTNEEVVSTGT